MVEALLESPAVSAVGWSLVAFVWQGALIGAATAVVLWAFRGRDPRWRYAAACLGLLVMTALPIRTAVVSYSGRAESSPTLQPDSTHTPRGVISELTSPPVGPRPARAAGTITAAVPANPTAWLQATVVVWFAGVTLLSLRLAGGWLLVCRMTGRGLPIGDELSRTVRRLARNLHVLQPVCARESAFVDVPTVVGWLRPTILLPASAIAGLAPEQLEAVLAHELAHIRRHDYGVNLLQRVAETLFFYHPAVWWLSNRIRAERELCADDLAVATCGDAALYAGALRDLEAVRTRGAFGVAATGGSLTARIARLLGRPPARDRWSPVWVAGLLVSILLTAGMGSTGSRTEASAAPELQATAEEAPVPGVEEPQPVETPRTPLPQEQETERTATVNAAQEEDEVQVRVEVKPTLAFTGGVSGIRGSFLGIEYPTNNFLGIEYSTNNVLAPEPIGIAAAVQNRTVNPIVTLTQRNAWMGVTIEDGENQGALVQSVEPNSPAAMAGILAGDLITELDGMRVVGARQLSRLVEETPAGRRVPVTVVRDGEARIVDITLSEQAPRIASFDGLNEYRAVLDDYRIVADEFRWYPAGTLRLGIQIQEMTRELREFFGAAPDAGVLVASVGDGSAASEAGILVGDVIVAAGGNPVRSRADLSWSAELDDDTVVLGIVRDRNARNVTVTLDLPPRSLRIAP